MAQVSKKLYDALNEQIRVEIESAYLYLSMSTYCESINFKGAGKWLRIQWEEELGHAQRLLDYLASRGNRAVLKAIGKPEAEFQSLLQLFETVLGHEKQVSESINGLYGLAVSEKDFAAQTFLQWYLSEQVEEESNAAEIVETLKLAGSAGPALLMVDAQLGSRAVGSDTTAG